MTSSASQKAGLVMSFDDLYTTDWVNYHDNHGKSRNWKATFFANVGGQNAMDDLKYLYDEGHEIANHTNNSFADPEIYINSGNTIEDYYNTYVKTFEDVMITNEIPKPTAFRFPSNRLSHSIKDDLLNNRGYKIVTPASRAPFETPITDSNYFYNFDKYPIAIDMAVVGTLSDYQILMDYALANKLVLNVFAHNPTPYITIINGIIDYANLIRLPMLHVSALADITGSIPSDTVNPTIGTLQYVSGASNEVTVSCTANDNIKVVGWDIYENGLNLYPWYSSTLSNKALVKADGVAATYAVKAFDKTGNRSPLTNVLSINGDGTLA